MALLPVTVISSVSLLARVARCDRRSPQSPGSTCSPKTAAASSRKNAFLHHQFGAPDFPVKGAKRLGPSSAGWKINCTVPGKSGLMAVRISATAMSIAVCAS